MTSQSKPAALQLRVGTDLVKVATVAESIARFGARYLERIYTASEIAYCQESAAEMHRRFAARFAAKESVLKVLRPDQHWLDWRQIEIIKAPGGWCEVQLHGPAEQLARHAGVVALSLSVSHEDGYALAMVAATICAEYESHDVMG